MKKLMFRAGILLVWFLLAGTVIAEEEQPLKIGRVYPYMPEVTVELSGISDIGKEDLKAILGERQLKIADIHPYNAQTDSTKVYILLDVSTSMAENFEAVKKQLIEYTKHFGEKDELVLLTFGQEVQQVLAGKEQEDERGRQIQNLACNEDGTVLFKALSQTYELAAGQKSIFAREYIVVVSDGADFQMGNQTYEETLEKFYGHILPVHALCTEDTTQEAADNLGILARKSGGTIRIMHRDQEAKAFQELETAVSEVQIATLLAETNQISGQEELFTINAGGKEAQQKIAVTKFEPDVIPPEIIESSIDDKNKVVTIGFSEPVQHVDEKNAIRIINKEEKEMPIQRTEYDDGKNEAYLYMERPLNKGSYKILVKHITDISQENNELRTADMTVKATNPPPENETQNRKGNSKEKYLRIAVIGGVVLLLGFLITLFIILRKKQKKKADEAQQKEEMQRKESESSNKNQSIIEKQAAPVIEEERYHITSPEGTKVKVYIRLPGGSEQKLQLNIIRSIVFGRSEWCEVHIDDQRLSRRHFSITAEQDRLLITDLDSVNGTKLNGVPLKIRKTLKTGDKIQAGGTDIVIMG